MKLCRGTILCDTILCIAAWCFFVASGTSATSHIKRTKRQTKDSVSKDSSSYPSARDGKIDALTNRLGTLEAKVNQMEELEVQDTNVLNSLKESLKNVSQREDFMLKTMSDLSEKLNEVAISVDADENFWNYSTECGGVMISQNGKIAYVYTEPYRGLGLRTTYTAPVPSCIWTIRTNYRSNMHFQVTSLNPGVIVTEFNLAEDGTHTVNHTTITTSRQYNFKGPLIIVTSTSRLVSLSYQGYGKLIHRTTDFQHHYFSKPNGIFFMKSRPPSLLDGKTRAFTTLVTRIEPSGLMETDFLFPNKSCGNSSFHVQAGHDDFEGPGGRVKNNSACCSAGSSCTIRRYTLDGWSSSTYSTLLPNDNEVKVNWKSRANSSDSTDKCGGVLMGKGGIISYKKLSPYRSNERCIWVIYPFPKNAIRLGHFSSDFETVYDHLTVLEVDKQSSESTVLTAPVSTLKTYTGRVILVTFYTDASIVRQGFELHWTAVGSSKDGRDLDNEKISHNSFKLTHANTVAVLNKGFALYVMSNSELDGSSLTFNVKRKQGANCRTSHLKLLGTTEGQLSPDGNYEINPCITSANPSVWNITSPDGIGVILLDNNDTTGDVQIDVAWNFIPPDTTDVIVQDSCGGVIKRLSGRLSYKLDSNYENGERCIWLIHSPNSTEIQLKLVKEGFELCCDYLLVNTIDPNTGQINNFTGVLTRENNTRVFPGNLLIVTFRSDGSVTGRGFVLEYAGSGQHQNPRKFKLLHLDEVVGSYHYQRQETSLDGWNTGNDQGTDETKMLIIAYSTSTEPTESVMIFNATVEHAILGRDVNCRSDILNFYTTPTRDGFTLGESYPKEECKLTADGSCGLCATNKLSINDTIAHTFSSAFRAFVGIYKPVKSSVINNETFHIRWDSSSGCGGVEYLAEGRIVYKLNTRYKNMEQCIWTVNIANAVRIRFLLVSNGFEACCDNIILSSLDPKTGSISSSAVLKSGSSSAIMNGPVVFVTFRTDSSVTGEGFSLLYAGISATTTTGPPIAYTRDLSILDESNSSSEAVDLAEERNSTTLDPPTFNYIHFHFHRRNSSFSYPTGLGHRLPLGRNDIITLTFSPEAYKNESFLLVGTKIDIKALNLYVNNESCVSDSLRFYESLTREGFNASRSFTIPIPDTTSCTDAASDRQWACDNCFPNQTRTQQMSVSTTYPAFLFIYKSVTPPTREVGDKNFRIEWVDVQRGSEPTTTVRSLRYG